MKKIGIVTLVLVLLLGLGTVAAYARTKKVDLCVCPKVGDPLGDVVGWVIANKTAAGEIIVEVHVHKGQANTVFYVFIKYDEWKWLDDAHRDGDLNTNRQGNGNFHGTISSGGVTWVDVVVRVSQADGSKPRYVTGKFPI
ncbi:hypothetical protein ES703_35601 [subsurface metagenome]